VTVHTTEPTKIVHSEQTIHTVDNKAHLRVMRSRDTLSFIAITDSLEKTIEVEPKNSIIFWANFFGYIGFFIDMNNNRRFSYPNKVFVNSADATGEWSLFGNANNKGELYLHLSLSLLNHFCMTFDDIGVKRNLGSMVGSIGLSYYHSRNQFIHFAFSNTGSYTRRRLEERRFEVETMASNTFSFTNNHRFERFSIGYGISFTENTWDYHRFRRGWFIFPFPITEKRDQKRHHAFGLVFPVSFQLGERLHAGLVYRPTFFRPNAIDRFVYEHVVSLELGWKIRLKR